MNFRIGNKAGAITRSMLVLLAAAGTLFANAPLASGSPVNESRISAMGVIRGVVRDVSGNPIADATVAIFRVGTARLLKQVRSAADGSFMARILPGTYTVLAVAEGYNPVSIQEVEVARAAELTYGFKLQRAGSGNTLPEKRLDRNNPKWVIRSAQTSRSIYQNSPGSSPVADSEESRVEEKFEGVAAEEEKSERKSQTVAETYFGNTAQGVFAGLNIATFLPVSDDAEVILAGQTGTGSGAPQRIDLQAKYRPNEDHQVRLSTSVGSLGTFFPAEGEEKALGQFSVQALDEWNVRPGLVVVFGVDYSRFFGASDDFAVSPRLGLQLDLDAKTRFRSAYTTHTETRTWSQAIELEDSQILFREPAAIEDFVVVDGQPRMNRASRFEFGIERVLGNSSNLEANAFFDMTPGRGVGLASLPLDSADGTFATFTGSQQGRASGIRLVYTRRLNGRLSTAAGYSLGSGQKLSAEGITNPAELFRTDFFQSFFGQVDADLRTGTNVKTIFRFSPQATVFAIDPFQGRLAIYDPSLSVLVTQNLPTLGLPFQAQAIVHARNLFDFQTGVTGEEGTLRLNSQRRAVRGSILVRF